MEQHESPEKVNSESPLGRPLLLILYIPAIVLFELITRFHHFLFAFFAGVAFISPETSRISSFLIFLTIFFLTGLLMPRFIGEGKNKISLSNLMDLEEIFSKRERMIIRVATYLISITGIFALSHLAVRGMGLQMKRVGESEPPASDFFKSWGLKVGENPFSHFAPSINFGLVNFSLGLSVYWLGDFLRELTKDKLGIGKSAFEDLEDRGI